MRCFRQQLPRPRTNTPSPLTFAPADGHCRCQGARGGNFPTIFQNYTINNVHCAHVSGTALYVDGLTEMPIRDVVMRNVRVDQAKKATDFKNAVGFEFTGVEVNGKPVNAPPERASAVGMASPAPPPAGCRPAMGMKCGLPHWTPAVHTIPRCYMTGGKAATIFLLVVAFFQECQPCRCEQGRTISRGRCGTSRRRRGT